MLTFSVLQIPAGWASREGRGLFVRVAVGSSLFFPRLLQSLGSGHGYLSPVLEPRAFKFRVAMGNAFDLPHTAPCLTAPHQDNRK